MTAALCALLLSAAPSADARPGEVYRRFDYALMAKITAKNAAQRAAARQYDPVTWLPVEKKPPHPQPRRRPRPDRQEWARLVAQRNQRYRQRRTPPTVLFVPPPLFVRKPCPWMFARVPASY